MSAASSGSIRSKISAAVSSSAALTVHDSGAAPGLMGSKGITCEGLPTGRTEIIRDGVLVGEAAAVVGKDEVEVAA